MKKIREITASSNTINKMSELPRNFPGPIRNKGRYYHRNRKPQKAIGGTGQVIASVHVE